MWMLVLGFFLLTLLAAAFAFTDVGRKYHKIARICFYILMTCFVISLAILIGDTTQEV
jgi:uncharacterized membrane protein YtjA (UPF0391 family)